MPTKTSVGPNEVVRLGVLRLKPPLMEYQWQHRGGTVFFNTNQTAGGRSEGKLLHQCWLSL
jgi:hypothetical protein